MSELIVAVDAVDVRFPASREPDGSDAMNPEPDHSATHVTARTSGGWESFGLAFTVSRGNEITVAAVCSFATSVVGPPFAEVFADVGMFSARLTRDSQSPRRATVRSSSSLSCFHGSPAGQNRNKQN